LPRAVLFFIGTDQMNETAIQRPTRGAETPHRKGLRKAAMIARRFLIPSSVVTLYALLRWRAKISMRAEVELHPNLLLGRGTAVSSFTKMKATDGPLVTGQQCGFAPGCFISAGAGGIYFGDHVIVGPNVSIIASNYRYERLDEPLEQQGHTSVGIRIGRNVWIGANAVILDGAEIGDNSIIVANSLVNRRFPANCIIQGNPARVILKRSSSSGVS
jgi:acetyltransferase-like isoleucine patch superfamily enzyme